MTTTSKVLTAFWIFIVIALIWNFYSYNRGLSQAAVDHPTQQHFYFFHTNAPAATTPQAIQGPEVIQTAFTVTSDAPSRGSFTCNVTLKNVGTAPATAIQVCVRPFRGVSFVNVDVGGGRGGTLSDDDPISMISDWLAFPDLAPGESRTETDVFLARAGIPTGDNPKPQIIFEKAKSPSSSPSPSPAAPATAPETPAAPADTTPARHSGA